MVQVFIDGRTQAKLVDPVALVHALVHSPRVCARILDEWAHDLQEHAFPRPPDGSSTVLVYLDYAAAYCMTQVQRGTMDGTRLIDLLFRLAATEDGIWV